MLEDITLKCRGVVTGKAAGEALVTTQSISFWGGIDPLKGLVIDRKNELFGKSIIGKVLVFPFGKGSSTSSAVFLEAVRRKTSPAAIINVETEPLLVVGAILAEKLYGRSIPIVDRVSVDPSKVIRNGDHLEVDAELGIIRLTRMKGRNDETALFNRSECSSRIQSLE